MKLNKKCWFYLSIVAVCIVILVNTIFLLPMLYSETGIEFIPPRILNTLALVGLLTFLILYGLAIHHLKEKVK